jgi:hypothetical protein
VVGIVPTIIRAGTDAVGTLGITTVADGIRLVDRSVDVLDDDMRCWRGTMRVVR